MSLKVAVNAFKWGIDHTFMLTQLTATPIFWKLANHQFLCKSLYVYIKFRGPKKSWGSPGYLGSRGPKRSKFGTNTQNPKNRPWEPNEAIFPHDLKPWVWIYHKNLKFGLKGVKNGQFRPNLGPNIAQIAKPINISLES